MQSKAQILRDSDFQSILLHLPGTVLGRGMKQFTRSDYELSLVAYTDENREAFERLQQFCNEHPEQADNAVHLACCSLLDAINVDLAVPRNHLPNDRALRLDDCKMVIVTYLTPAVLGMKLKISEQFVWTLREEWLNCYPKQPYELITGETIVEGFQRKWYQCYITQAVCMYLGKSDDCYELKAFRHFRDAYLLSCPDGPDLITEYYRDAPQIVARIELSTQSTQIYPKLWTQDLLPCLQDIESGRLEDCKSRYEKMMRRLQYRFLHRGGTQ